LEAIVEPGTKSGQGHEDQWLGYLSQAGVEYDQPIVVRGETFKIGDLATQAQWDIHDGMEATWTLMALSSYLPSDAEWMAKDGSKWNLERIIKMEAAQDMNASACGGSHRLYGMSSALNRYLSDGGKLTGGWQDADAKIQQAISSCQQFQQPDGGFSTKFFARSASSPDIALRINTTGHQLEFLAMALPGDQIKDPWVTRSVVFLCDLLEQTKDMPLECAGLYHAVHGLKLYRERCFGAYSAAETPDGDESDAPAPTDQSPAAANPEADSEGAPAKT
jgi:hypothetical protein